MNRDIVKTDVLIESLIYEIRGKQVMLDSNLANLYHVETKRINEAVKNNSEKFPERFSWILLKNEEENLRSKISTSSLKNNYGGRRYSSRVFTEQGVAMLSTILKTKVAVQMSIRIMDAFVTMRHYIGNNDFRLSNMESKVLEHDKDIRLLQESFQKLEEKRKITEIYYNGQIYDAYSKIYEIFKSVKEELIIIDAYADKTILDIIRRLDTKVIIITKENNFLTRQDIEKYNEQYHNLTVYYDNTYHDRYFILDRKEVYHCGTSINRIGYKTFSITIMEDEEVYQSLIKKVTNFICNFP